MSSQLYSLLNDAHMIPSYSCRAALFSFFFPQVSLWNGYVIGSGVGASVGSRFRVATEETMFAMPETCEHVLFSNPPPSDPLPLVLLLFPPLATYPNP